MKSGLLCAATLALAIGNAEPASAFIVNVSGLDEVGTTINLGAGTYTVTFAGVAGEGLYDAWNPFSDVLGCDSNGANCAEGWQDFFILTGPPSLGVGLAFATATGFYSTALESLTAYQNALAFGGLFAAPSTDPDNNAAYSPFPGPIEFTLASPTAVNFRVHDVFFGDNEGGVSLEVSSTVPEPSIWAMMLLGFAGLGFAGYLSTRRFAGERHSAQCPEAGSPTRLTQGLAELSRFQKINASKR